MQVPAWINKANFYLFLWALYYLLLAFSWKSDGGLRQLLGSFLIVVSFYYFLVANFHCKLPFLLRGLNALIIMFSVYGLVLLIGYNPNEYAIETSSYDYLRVVYKSLLPIYAFYYFTKKGYFEKKIFFVWVVLFFVLTTLEFYGIQQKHLLWAISVNSKRTEFTNNIGYSFLALLPLISFFDKKKGIQYFAVAYCVLFMLFAVKRGALIIGSLGVCMMLWKEVNRRDFLASKLKLFVLCTIFVCMGFAYVHNLMESDSYFKERTEKTLDGYSSGRDKLYLVFADYFWNKTTPAQFLFGSGANATIKISYNYAHNDWLEIAVNQGVLGIMIYLIYWGLFARTAMSNNYEPSVKQAIQLLFLIYFMKTFFSMSYTDMSLPATFALGYCLAQEKNGNVVFVDSLQEKNE